MKKPKIGIIGNSGIGKEARQEIIARLKEKREVVFIGDPNAFVVNGVMYTNRPKANKSPMQQVTARILNQFHMGQDKSMPLPSNIIEEYSLIELKKSKLSSSMRHKVVTVFNYNYIKVQQDEIT